MPRDLMIIEFLKKENATTALISVLDKLEIIKHQTRPFRRDPKFVWVSNRDIKGFCAQWVKTHRE